MTWTLQLQFVESDTDGRGIAGRGQGFREQGHMTHTAFIEDIDTLAPRGILAVVDLT